MEQNEDKNSHSSKKTSNTNKSHHTNQTNKSSKSNNNNNNEEEKKEEEEQKPKFNPYIPDKDNPYNNMNFQTANVDELGYNDYIVLCYHCKNPIKIEDGWKTFECGNCHKLNQLPRKLVNELYFDNK